MYKNIKNVKIHIKQLTHTMNNLQISQTKRAPLKESF